MVELIVVITILAILGTIAFISLQGYSVQARDTKRVSDVRSLISKITIEHTKGASYEDLIVTQKTNSGFEINLLPATSHQGPANFTNLKENPNSFKDPLTGESYLFAYAVGNGYDFLQGATISEKNNNDAVVLGNYYQTLPGDTKGIIFDVNDEPLVNGEYGELPPSQGGNDDDNNITASNNCTSIGQILSATSRYTNKDGIEHNAGVQCDTNDIIVCTGNGAGITLAACNVGARYATSEACTNSGPTASLNTGNCITDRMGLHFQWGSSTGYKFENTYTLSTSYNYPVDTGLTQSSASTSDRWNQGPCPSGYHIPSPDEWYDVVEAGGAGGQWTLGTFNSNTNYYNGGYRSRSSQMANFTSKLKLPAAGHRYSSSGLRSQGSNGYYWSSVSHAPTASNAWHLYFYSSNVYPGYYSSRYSGYSVRCFKDDTDPTPSTPPTSCPAGQYLNGVTCENVGENYYSPVNDTQRYQCPANSTTQSATTSIQITDCVCDTDYMWNSSNQTCDNPYEGTAGVTEGSTHGAIADLLPNGWTDLIIRDGNGSGYIIMNKNLGATAVYNGETESTDVSTKIETYRGNHYQWGRNRAFPIASGTFNASNSPIAYTVRESNTTFIWSSSLSSNRYDWSTTQEDNLWGATTNGGGNFTSTISGQTSQGPCPTGRHVPSTSEWDGLFKVWCQYRGGSLSQCTVALGSYVNWSTLTGYNSNITLANFKSDLHLPFAGLRHRSNGSVNHQGSSGRYWSSSPYSTNAHYLYFGSTIVYPQDNTYRAHGFSVRCFKN